MPWAKFKWILIFKRSPNYMHYITSTMCTSCHTGSLREGVPTASKKTLLKLEICQAWIIHSFEALLHSSFLNRLFRGLNSWVSAQRDISQLLWEISSSLTAFTVIFCHLDFFWLWLLLFAFRLCTSLSSQPPSRELKRPISNYSAGTVK